MLSLALDVLYLTGALVLGLPYLAWRRLRGKALASPWRRLGAGPDLGAGRVVWLHAVSVGEVLAIRSLVDRLREGRPDLTPVITCTTATGLDVARRTYPDVTVRESPYDLSFALGRFLRRVRPALLVLVELELWPNHLLCCRRRGIPVAVVNGKVSERSARGYGRIHRLWRAFPGGLVSRFQVQGPAHRERLLALGVPPARVEVAGNVKFDNVEMRDPAPLGARLRAEHGFAPGARILLAGSTHPGEEAVILAAARRLRERIPDLRCVLVPRHPERVKEVLDLCRQEGDEPGLRSRPDAVPDPRLLVVDTMGELHNLYALSDLAMVGGTLVPVGGHNLLEPASFGLPIVVGPHLHTVREMAAALREAGALTVVERPGSLADEIAEALLDPARRARAEEGARRVLARHRGAVDRAVSMISEILGRERAA